MCKMIYAMGNMQFPMQCDTMCNVWTTILLLWLISMQWELCLGQSAMHCNTMHNVWSARLLPWTISHLTVTWANCYTRSFSYKKAAINTISFSHQKWAIKTMSHAFFTFLVHPPPLTFLEIYSENINIQCTIVHSPLFQLKWVAKNYLYEAERVAFHVQNSLSTNCCMLLFRSDSKQF